MTRGRRRVLIATFVAAFLFAIGYWINSPRVDSRFFGTWRTYSAQGEITQDAANGPSLGMVTYSADGTATNLIGTERRRHRWSIDRQGRFQFSPATNSLVSAMSYLREVYGEYFQGQDVSAWRTWKILEASDSRIVLESVGAPGTFLINVREDQESGM